MIEIDRQIYDAERIIKKFW